MNYIQNIKHSINTKGRDFICSDLHGCYEQLMQQLDLVSFDKTKDRLFSVGDLVDRGPDNLKCLDLLFEKWFFPVLGNHEIMMMDSVFHLKNSSLWMMNGGGWVIDIGRKELQKYEEVLKNTPLTISLDTPHGKLGICHAEPPTNDWNDLEEAFIMPFEEHECLWSREVIGEDSWWCDNVDLTIHGHTPVKEHVRVGNALFIDTGSFLKEHGHKEYGGVSVLRIDNILGEKDAL